MRRYLWISFVIGTIVVTAGACAPMAAAPAPGMAEPMVEEPPAERIESEAAGAPAHWADTAAATSATTTERLIIRTDDLELIVPDTEQALEQVQDLAEELGGYVVSLNTYQYQEGIQANVTLRVPAESFQVARERVKNLATTVRREDVSSDEVTEEYVDLESRLQHLRAKEAQLLEFLEEAEDTEAVLAVYEQLSYAQADIEQVTGRMQYLEDRAALATISVSLIPDTLAQPLEVGGWNLPGTVRTAVEALLDVLEFLTKASIYLVIVVLPSLVAFAAPVVGLIFLIRWLVKRGRSRRGTA